MEINIPYLDDPWFDNATESFYTLMKEQILENEKDDLIFELSDYNLNIAGDMDIFKDVLYRVFGNYYEYVFCDHEKKNGDKEILLKKHLNFDIRVQDDLHKFIINKPFKRSSLNAKEMKPEDWTIENMVDVDKYIETLSKNLSSKPKHICGFCGREYSSSYDNVLYNTYPPATKAKCFYGGRYYKDDKELFSDYNKEICPVCSLLGIMEWFDESIVYRTMDDKSFIYLPIMDNFIDLHDFKCNIMLPNGKLYCNLPIDTERFIKIKSNEVYTNGEYSTLLYFYIEFLDKCLEYPDLQFEMYDIPLGNMKSISINRINLNSGNFGLINQLYNGIQEDGTNNEDIEINVYDIFTSMLSLGKNGIDSDKTTFIQENLIKSFLEDDLKSFANLYKNNIILSSNMYGTSIYDDYYHMLKKWGLKEMKLTEEDLKKIKNVGQTYGKVFPTKKSLFYGLYNIHNKKGLLNSFDKLIKVLVGMEPQKYISTSNIVYVTNLLDKDESLTEDIVSHLKIYAGSEIYNNEKIKKFPKEE